MAVVANTEDILNNMLEYHTEDVLSINPTFQPEFIMPFLHETEVSKLEEYIGYLAHEDDLYTMQGIGLAFGVTDINSRQRFISDMYHTLTTQNIDQLNIGFSSIGNYRPEWWSGFLPGIYEQSDFMQRVYPESGIQSVSRFATEQLASHLNLGILVDYYNSLPDEGLSILQNHTDIQARFATRFMEDGEDVFTAFKAHAQAATILGNALERTSSITFSSFAMSLLEESSLSGTIHDFLVPRVDTDRYYLAEHHFYGSSRLGIKQYWPDHYSFFYSRNNPSNTLSWEETLAQNQFLSRHKPWYSHVYQSLIKANETEPWGQMNTDKVESMRIIGQKHFELNNHLGNVMSVVTDKLVDVTTSNAVTDALPMNCERTPSLFAAYDYYPFVRKTKRGTSHRFSIPLFYGSLLMPERYREETGIQCTPVTTTIYQPTWIDYADYEISDALEFVEHFEFPLGMEGTYLEEDLSYKIRDANLDGEERVVAFNLNEVSTADVARLQVGINNDGNYDVLIELAQLNDETWEVLASTSISTETMIELIAEMPGNNPVRIQFRTTDANFRLSHIGFTRRDMLTGTESRLICNSDSEFGRDYRFGWNTHEKVNEISGVGNHTTSLFGEFDTRLGRRWNLDPVPVPWESQYAVNRNNPISQFDPKGDDPITGIGEAISSFALSAGMDFMTGWLIEGKSADKAFNDIGWWSAGWDATKSYAIASFTPPGTATARKVMKLANSTAGKLTIGIMEKMTTKAMDNYSKGNYNDDDGDFDFDKINMSELFWESTIETLVEQGFGSRGGELLATLKKENKALYQKLSKLEKKIANGESQKRINNYTKKVVEQGNKSNSATMKSLKNKAKEKARDATTSKVLNEGRKKATGNEE